MLPGILNQNYTGTTPLLLDTIRHIETGHLTGDAQRYARSPDNALGPYQLLRDNLHNMGYGVQPNLLVQDAYDPVRSREIAGNYTTGYMNHINELETIADMLVGYNYGPTAAKRWVQRGRNYDELPTETKQYLSRAAKYLEQQQAVDSVHQMLAGEPTQREEAPTMSNMNNNTTTSMLPGGLLDRVANGASYIAGELFGIKDAQGAERGVLEQGNVAPEAQGVAPPPALNMPPAGSTMTQGVTTNTRQNAPLAAPPSQIGLGEQLIRMGGAMSGGALQGGLNAYQKAIEQYGAIEDYNRRQALDVYNSAVDAQNKNKSKGDPAAIAAATLPYAKAALDAINSVETFLDQQGSSWWPFNDVTGVTGTIMSAFPNTAAHDVARQIETIEAAVGFDRLQAMREASPTGGALGQVSQMELDLLKSSLGNLRQSQSAEEFRRNLMAVKSHYTEVMRKFAAYPGAQGAAGQQELTGPRIQLAPDVEQLVNDYASKPGE